MEPIALRIIGVWRRVFRSVGRAFRVLHVVIRHNLHGGHALRIAIRDHAADLPVGGYERRRIRIYTTPLIDLDPQRALRVHHRFQCVECRHRALRRDADAPPAALLHDLPSQDVLRQERARAGAHPPSRPFLLLRLEKIRGAPLRRAAAARPGRAAARGERAERGRGGELTAAAEGILRRGGPDGEAVRVRERLLPDPGADAARAEHLREIDAVGVRSDPDGAEAGEFGCARAEAGEIGAGRDFCD